MMRSKEKILDELDTVSMELHSLSRQVEALVDELDPSWRKKKERTRKEMMKNFKI